MFAGFYRPRSNFYRLPNEWFAVWQGVREEQGSSRILGMLKVTEYVIKWTWGQQDFDRPVRLSWHDLEFGRRAGKERLDRGTGLSSRVLGEALAGAVEAGLLERHGDEGRPSYLPHLRAEARAGFLREGDGVSGFPAPTANYFLVPEMWTDLTREVTSEALILATEYLFRHTWGWEGGWERPCWLRVEEIANGRRYRGEERLGERYDGGIGYSERTVRDAVAEGVRRGWLVWREGAGGERVYALHLKGMEVAEDGRFLGMGVAAGKATSPQPTYPALASPASGEKGSEVLADYLTAVEREVRALAREAEVLAAVLQSIRAALQALGATGQGQSVGSAESTAGREESKAGGEESTARAEESKAGRGGKYSALNTDTADTIETAAADTRLAAAGGIASLPAELQRVLRELGLRGRRSEEELVAAYQEDAPRVEAWIRYLGEHRNEFARPAGFLMQVVRDGMRAPDGVGLQEVGRDGVCQLCGGRGVISLQLPDGDPDHGRRIVCPHCAPAGGCGQAVRVGSQMGDAAALREAGRRVTGGWAGEGGHKSPHPKMALLKALPSSLRG